MTKSPLRQPPFLPMRRAEMEALGWKELDVLLIVGDAYVDHPAFGAALLGRHLVAHGYRAGIIAQPDWKDPASVARLGRPRLYAGVSAGALDSLLAHYTAFRKIRRDDAYTPGGKAGARPNRACLVYANLARRAFPGLPVVLGGIEASLRRATHYDFWSDGLRRSLLLDAKADLLVCGMGERAVLEIARAIEAGRPLTNIPGTAYMGKEEELPPEVPRAHLPSHEELLRNPALLVKATLLLERQIHRQNAWAVQSVGGRDLLLAPPAAPLSEAEMDALYELPFSRAAHPSYREPIPALTMLKDSITSHRGCGGGCSFCSLALHQGRRIASRSAASIRREAANMAERPGFSGIISDVGGPTANMWQARCAQAGPCRRESCCFPSLCPFFKTRQRRHVEMLRELRALPGVRHLRVASGIRADLALSEPDVLRAYTVEFTGGQLKAAPEHCAPEVLALMRKPPFEVFDAFARAFEAHCADAGLERYIVPYLMSAFPGCTEEHMRELKRLLAARGWKPQQVQCFTPTPGTLATAMYAAGTDAKGRAIPVARTDAERLRRHHMLIEEAETTPRRAPKTQPERAKPPRRARRRPEEQAAPEARRRKPAVPDAEPARRPKKFSYGGKSAVPGRTPESS